MASLLQSVQSLLPGSSPSATGNSPAQWKITDGSFKGQTIHVATPTKSSNFGMTGQTVTNERRLQVSERPLVDGATVEDFGRKPRTFQAELIFYGADYRNALAAFENLVNPPSPATNDTGILILPDLRDAVYAKYQRHTRTTQTESVTMISVSWIEDFTGTLQATTTPNASAASAAQALQNPAQSVPSLLDKLSNLAKSVTAATSTLNANSFVSGISSLESAVVNVRVALNSVLNIPKNARTDLADTIQRVGLELSSLGAAIQGIVNFASLLTLPTSPTRTNSSAGAVDFATVGAATSAISVLADGSLSSKPAPTVSPVGSYASAAAQLSAASASIVSDATSLEAGSAGNTLDFSDAVLLLQTQIQDILPLLEASSALQIVTNRVTSLPEVMFENGQGVELVDYYRGLNPQLEDILNIPAFAVVNL